MKILVLGGTGAMGTPLVGKLTKFNAVVYVTSRSVHRDKENIHYIKGNAHELSFVKSILETRFDTIIDFMSYQVSEFEERLNLFLNSTDQYIFFSSGRVYANSSNPLTEISPRLLNVSTDLTYLSSNEYSLTKAREEDLLKESGRKNWTIVRPYITYGRDRLQLGIYEKDLWLRRIIEGKTVVIPKDILNHKTTLTNGKDVSDRIFSIIGKSKAIGEVVNVASDQYVTWKQILNIYSDAFFDITGKYPRFIYSNHSEEISRVMSAEYQLKYDRLFNRVFDDSKIKGFSSEKVECIPVEEGLRTSVDEFMNSEKKFKSDQWKMNAYMDKITGERTPLKNLDSTSNRIKYLIARYTPYFNIKYGYKMRYSRD